MHKCAILQQKHPWKNWIKIWDWQTSPPSVGTKSQFFPMSLFEGSPNSVNFALQLALVWCGQTLQVTQSICKPAADRFLLFLFFLHIQVCNQAHTVNRKKTAALTQGPEQALGLKINPPLSFQNCSPEETFLTHSAQ